MRRIVIPLLLLFLTSCTRIGNYEARLKTHEGVDYQIWNKRGALLSVERPDGTKITADDRGHPSASVLRDAMTIMLLREKE